MSCTANFNFPFPKRHQVNQMAISVEHQNNCSINVSDKAAIEDTDVISYNEATTGDWAELIPPISSFSYLDVGRYFGGSSPVLLDSICVINFIKEEVLQNSSLLYANACKLLASQLALNGITHVRLIIPCLKLIKKQGLCDNQEQISHGACFHPEKTKLSSNGEDMERSLIEDCQVLIDALSLSLESIFITIGDARNAEFLIQHATTCLLILAAQTEIFSASIVNSAMQAGMSIALLSERSFLLGERLYCFTCVADPHAAVRTISTTNGSFNASNKPHQDGYPLLVSVSKERIHATDSNFSDIIVSELSLESETNAYKWPLTSAISLETESSGMSKPPALYRQIKEDLDPVFASEEDAKIYAKTPSDSYYEQLVMKRISMYASSLHGASDCFNTVIRAESKESDQEHRFKKTSASKSLKEGKTSMETAGKSSKLGATAQKIREENEKRLLGADLIRQQKVLNVATQEANSSTGRSLDAKLAILDGLRISKISSQAAVYLALLLAKMTVYADAYKQDSLSKASLTTSENDADFTNAVALFSILFEIIDDAALFSVLTQAQMENVILPSLAMFGFVDAGRSLIRHWASSKNESETTSKSISEGKVKIGAVLSDPVTKKTMVSAGNSSSVVRESTEIRTLDGVLARARLEVGKYKVRHSFVRFQLLFCGHLAQRSSMIKTDYRVKFSPDPWQVTLLDAVDDNESVLICAPTSSGKTFICYYAMEKVLRASDHGTVVYVAPNRALMDQVVADVYARFGHKQYPSKSGYRLFGYLSDLESFHPWEGQILVTFPEMLEKFVTSPLFCESYWKERVQWVILDEIHTISEENKSSAWEKILMAARCPVLALSATLGNKKEFYHWLSGIQSQAGIPCRLIDHSERYSDLQRYVYVSEVEGSIASSSAISSGNRLHITPLTNVRKRQPGSRRLMLLHPVLSLSYDDLVTDRKLPSDFYLLSGDAIRLWDALHTAIHRERKSAMNDSAPSQSVVMAGIDALNYEKMEMFQKIRILRTDIRSYSSALMNLLRDGVQSGEISYSSYNVVKDILGGTLLSSMLATQSLAIAAGCGVTGDTRTAVCDTAGFDPTTDESTTITSTLTVDSIHKRTTINASEIFLMHTVMPLLVDLSVEQKLPVIIFHFDRGFCTRLAVHIIESLERAESLKRSKHSKEERQRAAEAARHARAIRRSRDQDKKASVFMGKDSWIEEAVEMEHVSDMMAALSRYEQVDPDLVFYDQRWKVPDAELDELIETQRVARKMTTPEEKILLRGLYRGIGVHHRGTPKRYLSLVEHLFRLRHLQVVIAGNTLALGINMPCKSVVFAASGPTSQSVKGASTGTMGTVQEELNVPSPMASIAVKDDYSDICVGTMGSTAAMLALTPLDYRQASGRAGRRGYDPLGHVIFWGLSKPRMDALITSMIPSVHGDCSMDASMIIQAFHMTRASDCVYGRSTGKTGDPSVAKKKAIQCFGLDTNYISTSAQRPWNAGGNGSTAELFVRRYLSTPLCLLGQLNQTTDKVDTFSIDNIALETHFRSMVSALSSLGLLTSDCSVAIPTIYARLAILIPSQMPAAVIIPHLMRIGFIDLLCNDYTSNPDTTIKDLLLVLCRFVQTRYLPSRMDTAISTTSSKSIGSIKQIPRSLALPELYCPTLQKQLETEMHAYNSLLLTHFRLQHTDKTHSEHSEQGVLGILRTEQSGSNYISITGDGCILLDARLAARKNLLLKLKAPFYAKPPHVVLSAYIWDYFLHQDTTRIENLYGVSEMELWRNLNEFSNFLKQLKEMVVKESSVVSEVTQHAIRELCHLFHKKFRQMWA